MQRASLTLPLFNEKKRVNRAFYLPYKSALILPLAFFLAIKKMFHSRAFSKTNGSHMSQVCIIEVELTGVDLTDHRLNHMRSGVNCFCSTLYNWGVVNFAACECDMKEQTASRVISCYGSTPATTANMGE